MADSVILIKNERDPLAGLSRQEFETRLKKALHGRVAEAWLFGSYAAGNFGPDSDVDLGPRMDILVYTPDEFIRLTSDPSPGFWRDAVKAMRRLL